METNELNELPPDEDAKDVFLYIGRRYAINAFIPPTKLLISLDLGKSLEEIDQAVKKLYDSELVQQLQNGRVCLTWKGGKMYRDYRDSEKTVS